MAAEPGAGDTADTAQLSEHAQGLLKMTRDTEFLQSFLRVDLGNDSDPEETKAHNQRTAAMSRRAAADKAAEEAASASPSAGVATSSGAGQRRASVHEKHRDGDTTPRAPHKTTFSQLTRDMKLKKNPRRKRGKERRQEEFYTDRDRAATVNMGSRDLKRDIKEKQRLDRSRTLQIPDEADPGTLLALGNHEMRGGDVNVAINFVHKALELNPSDKNALVARSKCYLLMGEPQKALQDAETALQDDKTFIRAIYQKAESLYHLGDFEHSLMFYHRGHRIRPELEGFRLGVQKAQEAIENTIGGKTLKQGPKKAASGPKIVRVDTSDSGSSVSVAGSVDKTAECGKPKARAGSSRRRSSQHLLGELSVDKVYLEQLLNHPDLKCPHQESAKHITSFAEEGVAFLNNRQEFWRQQRSTNITNKKAKS